MKHFKVYRFYDPGDAENGPRLEEEFVGSYDTHEEAQSHAGDGFRIEEADTEDDTIELYEHHCEINTEYTAKDANDDKL